MHNAPLRKKVLVVEAEPEERLFLSLPSFDDLTLNFDLTHIPLSFSLPATRERWFSSRPFLIPSGAFPCIDPMTLRPARRNRTNSLSPCAP